MFTLLRCSPLAVFLVLAGWTGFPEPIFAQVPQDVMLTFQARRHLDQDEALTPFNIGVKVRDGVATLFGSLPSSELIQKAETQLRGFKGLKEVRCELQVKSPSETPALQMPVETPPEPPRRTETVSLLAPILTAEGGSTLVATGGAPVTSEPASRPAAHGGERGDAMLAAAVEEIRWTDPRFVRVQADVRRGTVYLRGQVSRGEDGMELARKVAQIPGVAGVVLKSREAPVLPGRSH